MKLAFIIIFIIIQGCVKDERIPVAKIAGNTGPDEEPSTASDPLSTYAWHLKNTGQTSFSTGAGVSGQDIKVDEVHTLGLTGKDIRIAVSDTGTEYQHQDLEGNQLIGEHRNYFFSDSSKWHGGDPNPVDGDAHGTAVTGLIAALGWNGFGSRGVAPNAKYAGFRFLFTYPASTTDASYYARYLDQMDGEFDIFNYSYGTSSCSFMSENSLEHTALESGARNLREGKGALYVQSSGNGFRANLSPSCITGFDNTNRDPSLATPFKLVVGAVNASGVKSSYSTPGSSLWVSSPGGEFGVTSPAMITTDLSGCSSGYSKKVMSSLVFNDGYHSLNLSCNYTSIMNGTSSAAPVLSGVIALILESNPDLTWRDVKHILASTSDKIDYSPFTNILNHPDSLDLPYPAYIYDEKWVTNAAGYQFSNWYGFGRINALAAVQMAESYSVNLLEYEATANPNSEVWYYTSGDLVAHNIPDNSSVGISSSIPVIHNFSIEAVQIRLTTDHTYPGDLAVHLVSPSGTESRLLNVNGQFNNLSLDEDFLMISNAFYGEESYGTWTIKVYDGMAIDVGELTNWKINIHGHRKSVAGLTPNMPGVISMAATYASSSSAPLATFAHSTTSNITRYEVSVGSTSGATDKADWYSIGYNNSFQTRSLVLNNLTTYYVNVRAIDINEQASLVRSQAWTVNY